ncbi:MAG: glycosyltransferase family 4 protein [Bacteroidota bacterium]|nr:glycosyltransferase family 4 protein [Bacteroidota bacterium]
MPDKRIKVLLLIDEAAIGGGQNHVLLLAGGIDKNKFDVIVACEPKGYLVDELHKINIQTVSIILKNHFNPLTLLKMIELLKNVKPDVLHTHGGTPGFWGRVASKFYKVPAVVHTFHGIHYLTKPMNMKKWIFKMIDRYLKIFTDYTICVAEADLKKGLKSKVMNADASGVVRNGIDIKYFERKAIWREGRELLNIPADATVVGTIGRLHEQKGYEYLIDAAKHLIEENKSMCFLIVGEGELRANLERQVSSLHIRDNVIFAGARTDIPKIMTLFDLFVLPSLWEGLPLVLLEAMVSRVPIVASAVDGVMEIIEHNQEGILIPPKNSQAIKNGINILLNDKEFATNLTINAYKKVTADFSSQKMVSDIEDIYINTLSNKGMN